VVIGRFRAAAGLSTMLSTKLPTRRLFMHRDAFLAVRQPLLAGYSATAFRGRGVGAAG